jgi:hypothetical protein
MVVASWRVREELPISILTAAALFAYLMGALLLAEIDVPFVWRTDARKAHGGRARPVSSARYSTGTPVSSR